MTRPDRYATDVGGYGIATSGEWHDRKYKVESALAGLLGRSRKEKLHLQATDEHG